MVPTIEYVQVTFQEVKKTYLNNIPTELTAPKHAKTRRQLFRQEIDTPKECEDELLNLNSNSELVERENLELSSVVCTPITNEMKLKKEIDSLKEKYNDLQRRSPDKQTNVHFD